MPAACLQATAEPPGYLFKLLTNARITVVPNHIAEDIDCLGDVVRRQLSMNLGENIRDRFVGDDVVAFLAASVNAPGRVDRELKVGGPDAFMFPEIGEVAADILGKRETPQIRSVPLLSSRETAMIAGMAGLVSRRSRRFFVG